MKNLTKSDYATASFGELAVAIELQTLWQLGNEFARPAYRKGIKSGLKDGALWGFIAGLAFSIATILIVGG
jgi:hypothetical protein